MAVSLQLPLSNVLQTVERPVIFDVIRQLMELTQISSKTPIRFYGEDGQAAQFNSTITKDKESDNRWPHKENITISVEDDFNPDHLIAANARKGDAPMVFHDKDLDISIRPFYSTANVRISVTYKAVDKNEAERWRNDIRYRYSAMRELNMHTLTYSYHLNDVAVYILRELHRMREHVAGYGETFEKWFTQHLTNRATILSNQSGTRGIWAIAETQSRVQGIFDFAGAPEKASKEDEPNLWSTSFTYTFSYDKPIEIEMNYPLVVHQQLLDEKYRYNHKIKPYQELVTEFAQSLKGLGTFEDTTQLISRMGNRGLNIPSLDNFKPNTIQAGTVKVANVLTTISPEDKRYLFNLDDLGDYNLRQEVLTFLKESEYPYLAVPYGSIFQLSPYVGQTIRTQELLSVDDHLRVSGTVDFNLRHVYHVRLSMVANLYLLPESALRRLALYPQAAAQIINAINQAIQSLGYSKDIPYRFVPVDLVRSLGLDYDSLGRLVRVTGDTQGRGLHGAYGFQWGLVETLFVSPHRLTDLVANTNTK